MARRINLLLKRKDYIKKEMIFSRLRIFTYIIGASTLFLLIGLYFFNSKSQGEYERLLFSKEFILKQIINKQQEEKKLISFMDKSDFYNKTLSTDVNFGNYYNKIQRALLPEISDNSSPSAALVNLNIDNKRDFKVTIKVFSESGLMNLLKHVENSSLNETFGALALESFTIKLNPIYYEVNISGKVKSINNTL